MCVENMFGDQMCLENINNTYLNKDKGPSFLDGPFFLLLLFSSSTKKIDKGQRK